MKILITGASGFVGSGMTRLLAEAGHEVSVLHRKTSDLSIIEDLKFHSVLGDVTDKDSIIAATKNIDHVFHLAGFVGYSKSARKIMEQVNVEGTQNVVDACIANSVKRLLHFSSVVTVGAGFTESEVLDEESVYNVHHLNLGYFETKRNAELIVKDAVSKNLLDAVIVNPSTIYGPGDAKKGSRSTQLKVAQGKFPFYPSGGVSIVHIDDVISATYRAWQIGATGERYILSGDNIKIKEVFDIISDLAGVQPPKIHLPTPILKAVGKVGDVLEFFGKKSITSEVARTSTMYHWFDCSKAKSTFDFNPKPARTAIQASIDWSLKNELI